MDYYVVSDETLTSIANAIRNKTGENKPLIFPDEFVQEIELLSQDAEIWDGNYNVIPSIYSQILNTKGKIMANDIIVNDIPYSEVSNTSGGNTVHIGF